MPSPSSSRTGIRPRRRLAQRSAQTPVETLSRPLVAAITLSPAILLGFYSLLLVVGRTRRLAFAMLVENGPVELATFALLLAGGIFGLRLAWEARRQEPFLVSSFYAVFAVGLLLTAMEEIAWGQWFFGFETPAAVRELNRQGELTLHNLQGVHEHLSLFNAAFGVGGLVGVLLNSSRRLRVVSAPRILCLWFLLVALLAVGDIYAHAFPLPARLDRSLRRLAELGELMIAVAAVLYLWLNARRFRRW